MILAVDESTHSTSFFAQALTEPVAGVGKEDSALIGP